jgi:hypothetical protein
MSIPSTPTPCPGHLSDGELLAEVARAAAEERHATAHLLVLLIELDARRLYLGEGFSSLFTYCTQAMHLSEHAAYYRIEAARAARRFPIILEYVGDGALTLTAVRLLAPHVTPDNHRNVLASARHKNKREVELLVASLHPQPMCPRCAQAANAGGRGNLRKSCARQAAPRRDRGTSRTPHCRRTKRSRYAAGSGPVTSAE